MKRVFLFASFALLSACAHHRDVRPGEAYHRVVVKSEGTEKGTRDAISQANHYCEQESKRAVFLNENQSYTGKMKEEDYNRGKTIAKVASAAGGAVWVMGGQRESALGGLVGLGGAIADGTLGNGYTVEMRFKCR